MEPTGCRAAVGGRAEGGCAWCGAPLPPPRRRFCSDGCAALHRVNHYWPAARGAALERDGFRCRVCRDVEDLEVHHVVPVGRRGYGPGCHHHLENLETLCATHHAELSLLAA